MVYGRIKPIYPPKIMNMKSVLLLSIASLFFLSSARSQTQLNTCSVKGVVIDSITKKGLDFITIALKTEAGQPLKSTLTKSDGSFLLENPGAGKYKIAVVAMGYKSAVIPVNIDSIRQVFDLGKIVISTQSNELNEVVVTAQRPLIKQEVDRIVYDIQADAENKINSVLDMMRKVPLLSLDAEDNIKLKGQSNYKILINGKPSSMIARNPKDVLRSMPASGVQKIEVITTPPSKYDSEGLAGIINIITTKKIDNGYNGNINVRHSFPAGGPGFGGSFTIKQGRFGASGYTGAGTYNQPETTNSGSRISTGLLPGNLMENGTGKANQKYGWSGAELSYEIDNLNLLTAGLNINNGNYNSEGKRLYLLNTPQNIISYNLANGSKNSYNGMDISLNYQLGFKKNKDRLLTFSYQYNNSKGNHSDRLEVSNRVNYAEPDYQQTNNTNANEQTIQADYVHPLGKLNIEAGLKGILRNNNSNFQYKAFNANTGQFEDNTDRTNKFNNNQNVIGMYNSYQYNLTDWGFKAGLRVEHTHINADFISSDSKVNTNYFNLIPSVSVQRKFENMSSLNLGFTQRIERPGIYQLNPFVNRSNPNFESSGNPDIKPVLSNNIELAYSIFKKGSVTVGLNYSFANNTIQQVSVFDASKNITCSSYLNIGKDRSFGSNFNINYPITSKWNFNISGNLNYVWTEGMINNVLLRSKGINGYFYGGSSYKFDKGWRANAFLSYSSSSVGLQEKSTAWHYSSFSVSKDIIKDKFTLSASVSNPFSRYRKYVSETTGPDFTQTSNYMDYFRRYNVSINYRFGKLKDAIKKNQRGINNDDVKGKSASNP